MYWLVDHLWSISVYQWVLCSLTISETSRRQRRSVLVVASICITCVAMRFEVVGSLVVRKHVTGRGSRGIPTQFFWNMEAMRLLLRPLNGDQNNASRRQDDRVSHAWISSPFLSIAPYYTGFSFPIVCWSRKPHPSQMRLARINHSLGRKERLERVKRLKNYFYALLTAISQVLTCHHPMRAVGIAWATPSKPWVREKVVWLKPD